MGVVSHKAPATTAVFALVGAEENLIRLLLTGVKQSPSDGDDVLVVRLCLLQSRANDPHLKLMRYHDGDAVSV